MDIHFNYQHVRESERLEAMATEKLEELERRYSFITTGEVHFRAVNTEDNTTGMKTEFIIGVPGPQLFAESSGATFEESLSDTYNKIKRQLEKKKGEFIDANRPSQPTEIIY